MIALNGTVACWSRGYEFPDAALIITTTYIRIRGRQGFAVLLEAFSLSSPFLLADFLVARLAATVQLLPTARHETTRAVGGWSTFVVCCLLRNFDFMFHPAHCRDSGDVCCRCLVSDTGPVIFEVWRLQARCMAGKGPLQGPEVTDGGMGFLSETRGSHGVERQLHIPIC